MIRKNYFVITFNFFVTKIIAWLILSCMILSSVFVLNKDIDNKILESINSAENIFVQFFNISSMPADIISKMFVQNTETKLAKTSSSQQEQNKTHKNSTDNSNKYSILPSMMKIINTTNTKNISDITNASVLLVGGLFTKTPMCDNFTGTSCRNTIINLIMMLLLAILLSQKNLGEEGISNINIKNKYRAQFA